MLPGSGPSETLSVRHLPPSPPRQIMNAMEGGVAICKAACSFSNSFERSSFPQAADQSTSKSHSEGENIMLLF